MNLLKKTDVASLLNVSLRTVDRLREKGLLLSVKIMESVRFRPEDVHAYHATVSIEGRVIAAASCLPRGGVLLTPGPDAAFILFARDIARTHRPEGCHHLRRPEQRVRTPEPKNGCCRPVRR